MRKLVVSVLLVSGALVSKNATAQMFWQEVQTTTRGCATSIAVGPNDVPWVIGCGSGADNGIFYLASQDCSPNCFGTTLSWQSTTGAAKQVSVNRDGVPFVVNSQGNVYAALTHSPFNQYANIFAWQNITSTPQTCISSIAAGENNGFSLVGVTPAEAPSNDIELLSMKDNFQNQTIYGLGCNAFDQHGDRPVFSWNWNLTDGAYSTCNASTPSGACEVWNSSPGWERLASANYGAAQAVLYNGSGPNNPQGLWIRDGLGGLWQYNDSMGTFDFGSAANYYLTKYGYPAIALTDHFVDIEVTSTIPYLEILQWSDQQGAWVDYMHAITPQNTFIVQIAASQPIQTLGSGTFGPSELWGLDSNGHIFFATPTPPTSG